MRLWTGVTLVIGVALAGCTSPAVHDPQGGMPADPLPDATATELPAGGGAPGPGAPSATPCALIATAAQAEGPYYRTGSPQRTSLLEADTVGSPLMLRGVVLRSNDCRPLAGGRVDLWQADGAGRYDNLGYGLRGHQLTDARGAFAFETVLPGVYPGRTPHIHVKVFAPDGTELLTTQIYLPGLSDRLPDAFFDSALVAQDDGPNGAGRQQVWFTLIVRDDPR